MYKLSLPPRNKLRNIPQAMFGDVTGRCAKRVDRIDRIKLVDRSKIFWRKVFFRANIQPGENHIGNAAFQRPSIEDFNIQLIQIFQTASCTAIYQLWKIFTDII